MSKSVTWDIEKAWLNSGFANAVNSFEKAFNNHEDRVSLGRQSQVFRYSTGSETYYIKQYFQALGFGAWFGLSRCQVEVRNLKWFAAIGINCAPLVAHGIEKKWFRIQRGVLVTANVKNSKDLQEIAEQESLFSNRRWRQKIICQLADMTKQLHKRNFCHNDFQWRNILVTLDEDSPEIFLIDCPFGRRFRWPVLTYRKIKDLGSLDEQAKKHLSKTDRLRFYKHYRGINRLTDTDKKSIRTMLERYPG